MNERNFVFPVTALDCTRSGKIQDSKFKIQDSKFQIQNYKLRIKNSFLRTTNNHYAVNRQPLALSEIEGSTVNYISEQRATNNQQP